MPAYVRAYVRLDRLYRSIWPSEVKVTEDGAARGNEFNDFDIGRVANQIGIALPHAKQISMIYVNRGRQRRHIESMGTTYSPCFTLDIP